jgi:hypothetical protein
MMASQQAKMQSSLLKRQAQQERSAGQYEATRALERGQRVEGSQIADYSALGLDIKSGSPLTVISDSATENALDVQAIRTNAQNRALNLEYQAKIEKKNAKSAMIGGVIGGLTPLINAAGGTYLRSAYA